MVQKNGEHDAESDRRTVIEPDQVAVVYDNDDGYMILIPQDEDDESELPEPAVVLIGVALRLTNETEFYNEMLEWWQRNNAQSDID